MSLQFAYNIKSLSLTVYYGEMEMDDPESMIKHALTSGINIRYDNQIITSFENGGLVIRSKELFKMKELKNEKMIHLYSESFEYFSLACQILNNIGACYFINEVCIDLFFETRLEDLAMVFTRDFPNVPMNESIFIQKSNDNSTSAASKFECTFNLSDLFYISLKNSLNNATNSCAISYAGRNKITGEFDSFHQILTRNDIISIYFNQNICDVIQYEFDNVFRNLYDMLERQGFTRESMFTTTM